MNRYQQFCLLIIIMYSIHLGMYGLFQFDLVKYLFKTSTTLPRILDLFVFFCGMSCISLYQSKSKY